VGLTGELRPVTQLEARLEEARAHGFTKAVVGLHDRGKIPRVKGMHVIAVQSVRDAVNAAFEAKGAA
jgi:DNA repair protein RadA/Sms